MTGEPIQVTVADLCVGDVLCSEPHRSRETAVTVLHANDPSGDGLRYLKLSANRDAVLVAMPMTTSVWVLR
jgi:hypothetical protein